MHLAFLNPQGNFDPGDSHLTEHPDFGGQLIYVKELALAAARLGHEADILTRKIEDSQWPEFSADIDSYPSYEESLRIVRIAFGGKGFLPKEKLWTHLADYVKGILDFYQSLLPDFFTAHYADGGLSAVYLKKIRGIPFTFTAHSLGAQKLDKLAEGPEDFPGLDRSFHFSKRIAAERASMAEAARIITSTDHERSEQYNHPLYKGAVEASDLNRFAVIPPGVNTEVFNDRINDYDHYLHRNIEKEIGRREKPAVILSSRLDAKKNHISALRAFLSNPELAERAELGLFLRGIKDPFREIAHLPDDKKQVLEPMLVEIENSPFRESVFFLNLQSQRELAAAYKYFARNGSIFALTAVYEPFGLAPIEAAACGLAVLATQNGGPSEIFSSDTAVLVDPLDIEAISVAMVKLLEDAAGFAKRAKSMVRERYSWERNAMAYLEIVQNSGRDSSQSSFPEEDEKDIHEKIMDYLNSRGKT